MGQSCRTDAYNNLADCCCTTHQHTHHNRHSGHYPPTNQPPPHAAGTTITMVTRCVAGSTRSPHTQRHMRTRHTYLSSACCKRQQCMLHGAPGSAPAAWGAGRCRPTATRHNNQAPHGVSVTYRLQASRLFSERQQVQRPVSCCCPRSTCSTLAPHHTKSHLGKPQTGKCSHTQGTNESLPAQPWSAGPPC
jgi:hypothetical protein